MPYRAVFRRLNILGIIVALLAAVGWGAYLWVRDDMQRWQDSPLLLPEDKVLYEIRSGMSVRAVAEDLQARGYLSQPLYFRALAQERQLAEKLKSGEYVIERGMTPLALLDRFAAGRTVEYSITLVEGWSFAQVRAALEQHPVLINTFKGQDEAAIMQRLGHPGEYPEGRFFPDTYHIRRGSSDAEVLARAYERMDKLLLVSWSRRAADLPYQIPYEALIMASLIEKETAVAGERPLIAAVFLHRLRLGMKLQTDPTVIYGMGAAYDGNLRKRDLETDTPYNTYTHLGLPPTPIAMPGRDAIEAALHPADTAALYFVSRGDGSHQFSNTIEEHNRAVARYQLSQKNTSP